MGLIVKEPDGDHVITPFGSLLLRQITGLEFISKHRYYFSSHALGRIPPSTSAASASSKASS